MGWALPQTAIDVDPQACLVPEYGGVVLENAIDVGKASVTDTTAMILAAVTILVFIRLRCQSSGFRFRFRLEYRNM